MQVITDSTEARDFIKNLSQSLMDLAYWKDWSALFVTASPPLDWLKQGKITALLRSKLPDGKGTILWLEGCLVIVFGEKGDFNVADFTQTLNKSLGMPDPKVDFVAIDKEVQKFSSLLAERLNISSNAASPPPAGFTLLKNMLPNIEDLFREWNQNKQNREGRTSPHLMIVDDDLFTLRLVSQTLEKHYTVITAANGAEAIAKHLQLKPDIIFLDVGLPDCDGLTVLNYMQQYDKDCRIVMFSADDYLKTRLKAYAGGAKGYLPKPFNLQSFQKYIAQWVAPSRKDE